MISFYSANVMQILFELRVHNFKIAAYFNITGSANKLVADQISSFSWNILSVNTDKSTYIAHGIRTEDSLCKS